MAYITNNLTNPQTLTLSKLNPTDSLLKVGQILTANIDKVQGNQVQISLNNQTISATSKQAIQNTGPIQLQVKQLQPTLELMIVNSNKATPEQNLQQIVQAAYRQVIPNQTSLTQALQQINLLQSLPVQLSGPIGQLLEQISKGNQPLSGKELKNSIHNSGLFMESKLSNKDKPGLAQDLKAQLLKLQKQTETLNAKSSAPQLGQLSSALSQAISRITFQQLQLYENPYITALDLPFQDRNLINEGHIEIRKHTQGQGHSWEVLLELLLPLGELCVKLGLNQDGEINCTLWCETKLLEDTIRQQIDLLRQQFLDNNLNLQTVHIAPQKPIKSDKTTQISLIDIHI